MSHHKVCAIVVTYNGMRWVEKCLNSIIHSTIALDLYIVDNGSTDGTFEYLHKSEKCLSLHQTKENLGFGKANNLALKEAFGKGYDFFLLLNQDAWIENDVIENLIAKMKAEPLYGISSPLHYNGEGNSLDTLFESYLSRIESYQQDLSTGSLKSVLYESKFINAACWLMSRKTLEKVGLFHPLFDHYGEDDNYIDRLHYAELKLGIAPDSKAYHDRESVGVNPIKNDPARLFRQKLLRHLLSPNHHDSWIQSLRQSFKISRRIAKNLSLDSSKFYFRLRCFFKFFEISSTVRTFEKHEKSELHLN